MNEGKNLSRGLHYTHIVLPSTSPNDQGLLLTIRSATGIETIQYKKSAKFVKLRNENGHYLKHHVSNQVLLGRKMILRSVDKTE